MRARCACNYIDDYSKICYVKLMRKRCAVLWIILFILLAYVVTPFVDNLVCTDCLVPLNRGVNSAASGQSRLTHLSASGSMHNGSVAGLYGVPATRTICTICANIPGPPPSQNQALSLSSVSLAPQSTEAVPLSSLHAIFRPPRTA